MILKITNSFYVPEKTDTRLRYSVAVPDDDELAAKEFKPRENFGFQENFRRTLDKNNFKQANSSTDVEVNKPKKSKIFLEIKDSIRLLENYINDAYEPQVKVKK